MVVPGLAWAQGGTATPAELAGMQARGQGRLRFLGLRVYDIKLWSPEPIGPDWTRHTLALELTYARSLKGPLIAERSLKEMRRQGEIAEPKAKAWLAAMTAAFPDVAENDRLVGRYAPGEPARFWFNGQPRPAQLDAEGSRWFFGIWLSPQTSELALREQLLGERG
jgi:hypothetical protein